MTRKYFAFCAKSYSGIRDVIEKLNALIKKD